MSRNIRVLRLGQAPGLGQGTLGRNIKIRTLAAKTTATKVLLALGLVFSGQSAWSYTVSGNTYTTNGSLSDVQSACNAAPDNGTVTVVIPSGTFSWPGTLNITNSLILQGANPGQSGKTAPESAYGTVIQNNAPVGSNGLQAKSTNNGHIEIKWIDFQQISQNGGSTSYCIALDRSDWNGSTLVNSPYTCMLHDCYLQAGAVRNYMVSCLANGIIIWNCVLAGNSGFQLVCGKYGWTGSWNTPDTYGMQDTTGLRNIYIEDCSIIPNASGASGYSINLDDNSRCVFRNSIFQDTSLGSHGQESSPFGARLFEIYNNTMSCSSGNPYNMQDYFGVRGGAGVMWGNTVNVIGGNKPLMQLYVFSTQYNGQIGIQTAYPAARQVGQGWSASSSNNYGNPVIAADGVGQVTEGIYLWNNVGWSDTDPYFLIGSTYTTLGRDYFFSAKPGYTPYTYPHPLHTKYAVGGTTTPASTPLSPQNLRVQ